MAVRGEPSGGVVVVGAGGGVAVGPRGAGAHVAAITRRTFIYYSPMVLI